MLRKNHISLHEAIVIALIHQPMRRASIEALFKYISERNLYNFNPAENFPPFCEELKLFYDEISKDDSYYFKNIGCGFIELKDTNSQFPIVFLHALKDMKIFDPEFFDTQNAELVLLDAEFGIKRTLDIDPLDIVCIVSSDKEMGKEFYLYNQFSDEPFQIRKYLLNNDKYNFRKIIQTIDPTGKFLVLIGKGTIINAAYFNLSKDGLLRLTSTLPGDTIIPEIKLAKGTKAKKFLTDLEKTKSQINLQNFLQKIALSSNF